MKALLAAAMAIAMCLLGAPAAAQEDEQGALLVIMDVSGSMNEDDGAGGTRIQGARAAVTDLVDAVPEGTPIGLRIYGGRYPSSNKAQGCRDTQLTVPIGAVESTGEDITSEIGDVTPRGSTPIGYSLQEAGGDFGEQSNRSIVLVSDGDDTCGDPDPCDVAEQLSADGIQVRVDTIGLAIEDNPQAQGQLECIAEASGGGFFEAADADELTEQLSQVATRAIEGWTAEGEEVDGGPIVTDATPIEPGTTYLDDVVTGEARWYSFPVQEGDQITVTLSEDGTVDYGCCIELRMTSNDQVSDFGFNNGYSDGVAKIYRTGTSTDEGAGNTGDYYFSVILTDDLQESLEYQFEVLVQGDDPTTEPSATETQPTDDAGTTTATDEPTAEPEETDTAAEAANTDDGNGLLLPLVIILLVAVLALGGAVVYLLIRMNRNSP
ncbi:MAG: VWA domain-containing protein [Ornithinimicrobium sp.]